MRLSVRMESGRVAEARFQTKGCTASVAAGSALTELLKGKSSRELAAIDSQMVTGAVGGLMPESRHAAVLCVDAVRQLLAAIRNAGGVTE